MPNENASHPPSDRAYRIYVIRLSNVAMHRGRFRNANPNYEPGRPVVYVGSTGQAIEERYRQHKKGGMFANGYVRRFGKRLFPWAYEGLASFATKEDAIEAERAYAEELRGRGWAVWQA